MTLSDEDVMFNNKALEAYNKLSTVKDKRILAKLIMKYYKERYDNLRTVTIKSSLTKTFFKDKTNNDVSFTRQLNPDKKLTKEVKDMNQSVLNNTTYRQISKQEIDNINKQYYNSNDLGELSAYVLLNTGRRTGEIIKGSFRHCKGKKNCLLFEGLLKKRDDNVKPVEIHTIDDSDKVLQAVNRLHSIISDKKQAQTLIQRALKHLPYDYNSHMYRVIYANYQFKYNNPKKLIYNELIKRRLNHRFQSTSINYSSIMIV